MVTALELLHTFLIAGNRNAWLYGEDVEVYVRTSFRALDSTVYHCLDVANAILPARPSGAYLQFVLGLPEMLQRNPYWPGVVYIEGPFPELATMFRRLGYRPRMGTPDLFKIVRRRARCSPTM